MERSPRKASQHVILHPDGGWAVKKYGSRKATRRFDSKQKAVQFARELSSKQKIDLYIHNLDGGIDKKIPFY
jgi:hypothetical protein